MAGIAHARRLLGAPGPVCPRAPRCQLASSNGTVTAPLPGLHFFTGQSLSLRLICAAQICSCWPPRALAPLTCMIFCSCLSSSTTKTFISELSAMTWQTFGELVGETPTEKPLEAEPKGESLPANCRAQGQPRFRPCPPGVSQWSGQECSEFQGKARREGFLEEGAWDLGFTGCI